MASPEDMEEFWRDIHAVTDDANARIRKAFADASHALGRVTLMNQVRDLMETHDQYSSTEFVDFTSIGEPGESFDSRMRQAYSAELDRVRHANDSASHTGGGKLGWDTMIREAMLHALATEDAEARKRLLIETAALALLWAETIKETDNTNGGE